jgi:BirA family biotin operon repressor/biotin-[acetyl-CoA-carboxylase] ligase
MASQLISEMDDEEQSLGSTLIVADRQDAGRGRGDRQWQSPEGGLYLSWLRSGVDAETTSKLPMLAAMAALEALAAVGVEGTEIKWPNDILVGGKKLAGILVFARHGESSWVTVGLGVNLATAPEIDQPGARPATCVADLVSHGDPVSQRDTLTCAFIRELASRLAHPEPSLAAWRARLIHSSGEGMSVRLGSGEIVDGTLVEITAEGFLRLEVDGHDRVITGGDIVEDS